MFQPWSPVEALELSVSTCDKLASNPYDTTRLLYQKPPYQLALVPCFIYAYFEPKCVNSVKLY